MVLVPTGGDHWLTEEAGREGDEHARVMTTAGCTGVDETGARELPTPEHRADTPRGTDPHLAGGGAFAREPPHRVPTNNGVSHARHAERQPGLPG